MDGKEAIKVLDTVCAQISMSRDGHNKVLNALAVLNKIVEKQDGTTEES